MSGIKVKQRLCPRKVDLDRSDFRSLCNDDDDDDDDFQPSTSLGRREWESNTDDDDDDGETNSTGSLKNFWSLIFFVNHISHMFGNYSFFHGIKRLCYLYETDLTLHVPQV